MTLPDFSISPDVIKQELSKRYFDHFFTYFNPTYQLEWFHKRVCDKLDSYDWKRLMIFMPPQHGKSSMVSSSWPSHHVGKHPDDRVGIISYSGTKASQFNRANQRIIDSREYISMFPDTKIAESRYHNVAAGNHARTNYEVEIIGRQGGLLTTGIGGAITGNRIDVAIIDDPIKDAEQANSEAYRERVWEWYTSVLETRLHNDSRVVIMLTRWHEDDLAGRLLAKMEEEDGEQWEVVSIPAIKEDDSDPEDPRKIGEALWPERHSKEKIMKLKNKSESVYNALYQQRPSSKVGNILKKHWFIKCDYMYMVERSLQLNQEIVTHFFLDTAYTEDQTNDPSGILAAVRIGNDLFVINFAKVYMELPEICEWIPQWVNKNGHQRKSRIYIEPKASGKSIKQTLKRKTQLNLVEYMPMPDLDKVGRANAISPEVEGGRVYIIKGSWNDNFLETIAKFPKATHDEEVDTLVMCVCKLLVDGTGKQSHHSF